MVGFIDSYTLAAMMYKILRIDEKNKSLREAFINSRTLLDDLKKIFLRFLKKRETTLSKIRTLLQICWIVYYTESITAYNKL